MHEKILPEVARWRKYALEDIREARNTLSRSDGVPRHAAFMAQQAAEKAVKAGLILTQVEVPRSHNLGFLIGLLSDDWSVKRVDANLGALTKIAIDSRYPVGTREITAAEAEAAVRDAGRIVDAMEADLNRRIEEQE